MARHLVLPAVIASALAASSAASADVLKVYGAADGGYMYGKGKSNMDTQVGFFEQSTGPTYGLAAGARLLFIDAHILHHQYTHDGISTWTQFNAGLDFEVNTGSEKDKKAGKGGYVEIGAWLGFGVATGLQVKPPLSNDQVSDKGFIAEGRFGFGTHLSSNFDLGLQIPASWGYIFRNGEGQAANDPDSQYQSIQVEALVILRANIKLL